MTFIIWDDPSAIQDDVTLCTTDITRLYNVQYVQKFKLFYNIYNMYNVCTNVRQYCTYYIIVNIILKAKTVYKYYYIVSYCTIHAFVYFKFVLESKFVQYASNLAS
jgi:hypothetical protein